MLLPKLEIQTKADKNMQTVWCWTCDHGWQALPGAIFIYRQAKCRGTRYYYSGHRWTRHLVTSYCSRGLLQSLWVVWNTVIMDCLLVTLSASPHFYWCAPPTPDSSQLCRRRHTPIFKKLEKHMRFKGVSRVLIYNIYIFIIPTLLNDFVVPLTTHHSLNRHDTPPMNTSIIYPR